MIMSESAKRRFLSTIAAPAVLYSSSVMPEPAPAFFSIMTLWPSLTRARTPPGTRPTRCSRFLISLGTPIFIWSLLSSNQTEILGQVRRAPGPGREPVDDLHALALAVAAEQQRGRAGAHHAFGVEQGIRAEDGRESLHGGLVVR